MRAELEELPPQLPASTDIVAAPLAPANRHDSTVGLAHPMRPLCTAAGARSPMPTYRTIAPPVAVGGGPCTSPRRERHRWCRRSRRMRQSRLKIRKYIMSTNE